MAAFPYFGACYFIVMTDIPSLLAVLVAVFAQIDYLQTGRERSVWTAGIVGLAAILIRQNAIYVTAVFGAALVLTRFRGNFFLTPRRPLRIWRELLPLGLPLLGLLWEVRLWDGLVPPDYSTESGTYLDASLRTYLLGLSSTAGNVGYYFMPATLILLATHRPRPHVRAWILLGLLATLGTCWCYHERGTDLVNTYGTFRHSLSFIRDRFGFAPSAAILFLSILSFGVILRLGMDELKSRERRLLLLLPVLLSLGSWMIISFGLFRIYERHVVPIYTFAVLLLWPSVDWAKNRWWQAGWLMSVLFGAGHSVLYAVRVYEMRR